MEKTLVYQTAFSGPNVNKNAPAANKYASIWRIVHQSAAKKASLRRNNDGLTRILLPAEGKKRRVVTQKNEIAIAI